MKINWRVRFRNPQFIIQVLIAFGVPILAYYGISASEVTSWMTFFSLIRDACANPFVLGTIIVALYNAVTDPTTAGVSDSQQALRYREPKKEAK